MQATIGIDRRNSALGGRLLVGFAVAVATALALGYGVGHVTAPSGHAAPAATVQTVPVDQSEGGRPATHGELP